MVKSLPDDAGDLESWVQSLGQEDPLEEEMATLSSILASEIPWIETRGPQSMGHKELDATERAPSLQLTHTACQLQVYTTVSQIYTDAYMHTQIIYSFPDSFLLSVQFSSVAQSCPTLCDPMNRSMPGLPVHHQLPEFTQTRVHRVVMPSSHLILCRPLLLLPPNPSQHQSLFQ